MTHKSQLLPKPAIIVEVWEKAMENYNPPSWPTFPTVSHHSSDSFNESDNASDDLICNK